MNTIEQQLWDYIDGQLEGELKKSIEDKIHSDPQVKLQYEAFLSLNLTLSKLDLEEPSMSFIRNVTEEIASVPAPVSMKTKVDTRIIYGIGGFFVACIFGILGFLAYNTNFTIPSFNFDLTFDTQKIITPTTINIFLFVDLILGLIFIDYYLRKRKSKFLIDEPAA
ncbi:hypothetical protein DHW03_09780 [Pedobacter yonginense]|uniref:Uncharacterized protein n=1 Tax=Pedobacter yonginense TaxID=651869 RepID=A0A317EMM4_9SPHI|nr:hypothetical protein [Pedobacter yonginense]PWS27854.1 hypothetical protein DHW03_09780 [Pedobacter yonginense]